MCVPVLSIEFRGAEVDKWPAYTTDAGRPAGACPCPGGRCVRKHEVVDLCVLLGIIAEKRVRLGDSPNFGVHFFRFGAPARATDRTSGATFSMARRRVEEGVEYEYFNFTILRKRGSEILQVA